MNDPDSFKHVETYFVDQGNTLLVEMNYQTVTERVVAQTDLNGNVLEIIAAK